jgi:hypothetical protein
MNALCICIVGLAIFGLGARFDHRRERARREVAE